MSTIAITAMLLAGCSPEPAVSVERPSFAELPRPGANALEAVKQTRQLVVAIHADADHRMFCYSDFAPQGFDVEMARYIAAKLAERWRMTESIDVHFKLFEAAAGGGENGWSRLLEALRDKNNKEFDLAIASISITDERRETMVFSTPYLRTGLGVVRYHGDDTLHHDVFSSEPVPLEELIDAGRAVAVHVDTTAHALLSRLRGARGLPGPVEMTSNGALFGWVDRNGDSYDTVVYDYVRTISLVAASEGRYSLHRIDYGSVEEEPEQYGVAFSPGNEELAAEVSAVLGGLTHLPEPGVFGFSACDPEVAQLLDRRVQAVLDRN